MGMATKQPIWGIHDKNPHQTWLGNSHSQGKQNAPQFQPKIYSGTFLVMLEIPDPELFTNSGDCLVKSDVVDLIAKPDSKAAIAALALVKRFSGAGSVIFCSQLTNT